MVKLLPVLRSSVGGDSVMQFLLLLKLQKESATDDDLTLRSFPLRSTQAAFSIRNSRNEHSVPFWLAQLIQASLNRLCSVQRHGRPHATHQSRLIQSRAISDDFAQSHSDLVRMFLRVTRHGGPKSPQGSLDNPAFFHGGTHSGFWRDRRSY